MMLNLSKTMQEAVAYIKASENIIYRFPGGFWRRVGDRSRHFGTPTIEALVSRGVLQYTAWQEGRNGKFPVKAEIVNI